MPAGEMGVEHGVEFTAADGKRRVNRYPKTQPEQLRERIAAEDRTHWDNGEPILPRVVSRTGNGPWQPVQDDQLNRQQERIDNQRNGMDTP